MTNKQNSGRRRREAKTGVTDINAIAPRLGYGIDTVSYALRGDPKIPVAKFLLLAGFLPLTLSLRALNAAPPSAGYMPHPSFHWVPGKEAEAYDIEVAKDPQFHQILVRDTIEVPRFVSVDSLQPGEIYWRTRTIDSAGRAGQWTATSQYNIQAIEKSYNVPASATLADIQSIIGTAAQNTPSRVIFPPKATYRLKPVREIFHLKKASDMIIDGNEATIIIEKPDTGFATLQDCNRITIRGFKIDYDPLPQSVVEIKGVDFQSRKPILTVAVEAGYPDLDTPFLVEKGKLSVLLDKDPIHRGRMKPDSALVINLDITQAHRKPGSNLFYLPVSSTSTPTEFAEGDRIVLLARKGGRPVLYASDCSDITYFGICIYAANDASFMFLRGSELKVLRCSDLIKDSNRWYSGNADGIHVRASRIGPWIEGCTIQSVGDDGIALYNKGIGVISQLGSNRVQVAPNFMDLRTRDRFTIWNPREGALIGVDRIVTDVIQRDKSLEVVFEPALLPAETLQAVPGDVPRSDQLFNRSARNSGFVIRHNTITGVRRFGTVFRSAHGLVADNNYIGTSSSAITNINEPAFWHNGLNSENIKILRNVIIDCTFDGSSEGRGSIDIRLNALSGLAKDQLNSQILIAGNRIENWNQRAISVQNSEGVEIRDNVIGTGTTNFAFLRGDNHAILVNDVRDCAIAGNDISGERRQMEGVITVLESENVASSSNTAPQSHAREPASRR